MSVNKNIPQRRTDRNLSRLRLPAAFLLALTAGASHIAPAAAAERVCGENDTLLDKLEQKFGERPQAIGIAADGSLLQVLVSPGGGWTMISTRPGQLSCVVAAGKEWYSHTAIPGVTS